MRFAPANNYDFILRPSTKTIVFKLYIEDDGYKISCCLKSTHSKVSKNEAFNMIDMYTSKGCPNSNSKLLYLQTKSQMGSVRLDRSFMESRQQVVQFLLCCKTITDLQQ